jgi:uncharacterized membrane protein YidH (DUF202 family)
MANERTALGWQRSALSLAVIAALLLGHAVDRGRLVTMAASIVLLLGAAWVGTLGRRLYRGRRTAVQGPATGPLLAVSIVTLLAAAVAVAELVGTA